MKETVLSRSCCNKRPPPFLRSTDLFKQSFESSFSFPRFECPEIPSIKFKCFCMLEIFFQYFYKRAVALKKIFRARVSRRHRGSQTKELEGVRVLRGPDWRWGEQDGGEGKTGIAYDHRAGWVNVSMIFTSKLGQIFNSGLGHYSIQSIFKVFNSKTLTMLWIEIFKMLPLSQFVNLLLN